MFADDHSPPHFHAYYGEFEALIRISDGEVMQGELPRRALRLVQDWLELHKNELEVNWIETQNDCPRIKKIEPLR